MAVVVRSHLASCAPRDARWLEIVACHPEATAFHLPAWTEAIAATYGYRGLVLLLEADDGRVLGGLPVIECRGPLGRRRLVSLPFTDHCPPLITTDAYAEFAAALGDWRASNDEIPVEVRAEVPALEDARVVMIGTRHLLALGTDSEAVFERFDRSRIQKRIRTAMAAGVQAMLSRSLTDLAVFYRLHCETRRRLGVPVQPERFFENVWEKVIGPGHGVLVMARVGDRPIGAALFLAANRRLIYKYSASDSTHWNLRPNLVILWAAMEWACRNGYVLLDMGRTDSDNESLRVFKAGWATVEVPLTYTHYGPAGKDLGRGSIARVLSNVIRRSPTLVCRALGETLYRFAA